MLNFPFSSVQVSCHWGPDFPRLSSLLHHHAIDCCCKEAAGSFAWCECPLLAAHIHCNYVSSVHLDCISVEQPRHACEIPRIAVCPWTMGLLFLMLHVKWSLMILHYHPIDIVNWSCMVYKIWLRYVACIAHTSVCWWIILGASDSTHGGAFCKASLNSEKNLMILEGIADSTIEVGNIPPSILWMMKTKLVLLGWLHTDIIKELLVRQSFREELYTLALDNKQDRMGGWFLSHNLSLVDSLGGL